QEQGRAVVAVELVIGRHVVGGVLGQERFPRVELPVVEQRRLVVEEILNFGARHHRPLRDRHASAPISSFQRRQKMSRRCSSLLCCSLSLPMPRDISDQRSSAQLASPCCTSSSASTSSGVAKPPGP